MIYSGSLGYTFRIARAFAALSLMLSAAGVSQLHGTTSRGRQTIALSPSATTLSKETSAVTIPEKELAQALELRHKLTSRDLRNALHLLADSSQRFRSSGRTRDATVAEIESGDIYQMISAYQQALAAYRLALSLSSGANDQANQHCLAASRIVRTYANMGQALEAQKYSDELSALCSWVSDKKTRAAAAEAQGEVSYWSSRMKAAEISFTQARDLASEGGDPDGEALATMMLAEAINGNDKKESTRLAWSALQDFVASGNEYGAARAHMNLALFANWDGEFDRAKCHSQKALGIFQSIGDKDNIAIAYNTLGQDARLSGDIETSLSAYRRAQKEFSAVQDDLGEAESLLGISNTLLSQNNYSGLRTIYLRELQLARKTTNASLLGYALVGLATVDTHQHRYAQADAGYQRALAQARTSGNIYGESVALMRRAELHIEQHRLQSALELLNQALPLKEQTGEVEALARLHYFRARIHFMLHELEAAQSEIEATVAIVETQRLRISKFDTRAQYFAFVHEYYSLYIRVLMASDRVRPGQGFAKRAFEAAEKSKVRALLDLLQSNQQIPPCEALLAGPTYPEATGPILGTPDAPGGIAAEALTVEHFQSEIGDGETVLLEYALGEEQSFAWLLDRGNVTAFDLGPAENIRNSIRLFRQALLPLTTLESESAAEYLQRRQTAKSAFHTQAAALAKLLLGPIHLPPGKRLLIVPDGPLQYLPFAALPEPGGEKDGAPLIKQHELIVLPSASVLAALRKATLKRPHPNDEVTVFADPVFQAPGIGTPGSSSRSIAPHRSRELTRALLDSRDTTQIPNLPGSRLEAVAIQQIVGSKRTRLALGFDANRGAILGGSLARQRIIHFATHGIIDTRHPEMSGLVLSMFDKHGTYQDGYLRLSDIYNLKLSADLVILSSCDSALGKDLGSEGIVGLPRGFLYAGARRVIASLWKVDDDASVTMMKALYSRLQQGSSPAAALRGAQLELLKDGQFSDPYYWAGFVLEGDFQ